MLDKNVNNYLKKSLYDTYNYNEYIKSFYWTLNGVCQGN